MTATPTWTPGMRGISCALCHRTIRFGRMMFDIEDVGYCCPRCVEVGDLYDKVIPDDTQEMPAR
jgi:phage FluMu protein Com